MPASPGRIPNALPTGYSLSMGEQDPGPVCVNHPRSSTLVRCAACNNPICVKCMNETPVGMKCPSCAQVEYQRPRNRGRRNAAGAAGLAVAAIAGALVVLMLQQFNLIVAVIVGLASGAAVRTVGAGRGRLGGLAALSAGFGLALGLMALGAPLPFLFSGGFLFSGAVAAGAAGFIASR